MEPLTSVAGQAQPLPVLCSQARQQGTGATTRSFGTQHGRRGSKLSSRCSTGALAGSADRRQHRPQGLACKMEIFVHGAHSVAASDPGALSWLTLTRRK